MRLLKILSLILPFVLLAALASAPPAVWAGFTSTPTQPGSTPVTPGTPPPGGSGTNPTPAGFPNLEFSKTANVAAVKVGDTVTYSIVVRNPSTTVAVGVSVKDTLAQALTFVSATTSLGTFTANGQEVYFAIGDINPGITVNLTITAQVNVLGQPPAAIANVAVLSSHDTPITSSNTASLQTVPGALPETGETPRASVALTLLLAVAVMFLPLAGLLWAKRRSSR